MATITYVLKNKNRSITKVYMRISISRTIQANFPLEHFVINPKHWDESTMRANSRCKNYKDINKSLEGLYVLVEDLISENYWQKELFNSEYFKNEYINFINKGNTDSRYVDILEFIELYIKQLKMSDNTIDIYNVTYNKIVQFLKDEKSKTKLFYTDVTNKWIEEFINYLQNHQNQLLGNGTINTYLSKIKLLLDRYSKINTIFNLPNIKYLPENDRSVLPFFSREDLDILEKYDFKEETFDQVRDWILISCETSLRISDFKSLGGLDLAKQVIVALSHTKTKNTCIIPINDRLRRIYKKWNGLPRMISDQKFNENIKLVCEIVGFDEVMYGSKKCLVGVSSEGKNIYRNVYGQYKRFELVTSHIGRRSFATNKYIEGKLPIPLIMSITAHKSTEEFYKYIQVNYVNLLKN